MSIMTHRFRNHRTLALAQRWLNSVGVPSERLEVSATGLPSLSVQTASGRLPAVQMIVNAAELTDPQGWPSLFTASEIEHVTREIPAPKFATRNRREPIGWHPID